ncbi:HlyD family type I secretion periplasmic adaptor subunit [Falsiruegeria mediterranea]|uniref:Membrane fusion protein (MFP) family protein n=1 Tax=Falsiruegeria mediterranea M17 TaxID=1200281 RepID=A0A2R8CGI6_9RHOB|nr:HlyD family type I secretion periplasmic adaptor subunit [Falsiruegeria mediterranea]SPJ31368.1 Type I secretion system membrane fusion protein PrsE [Falsiruegeria mediterranea M17]
MSGQDWKIREFAQGQDAARMGRSSRLLTLLLIIVIALVTAAVVWASQARIEEVARGQGRVVPSGKARVLESLEGGIVREILVREGDAVEAGQIIIRIDDTGSSASLGELNAQLDALSIRGLRLAAELAGADALSFDGTNIDPDSAQALREAAIFDSRTASYFGQRAVLEAQLNQRQREIEETEGNLTRVAEGIGLLQEEIELKTESGVVPRAQIIPIERELSARRQEQDALVSRREQARAALREAEARLEELKLQRRAEISIERSDTLNQISVIQESIKSASDVVSRAALRAPVTGIVSVLNVNTIGSVVAPGEELLQIVPQDDRLQVEARIRPEDVAFVYPGLPASVKLTSFDFTIYGALDGQVMRVGADAQQDEATGEIYFPIIVETESNLLVRGDESHEIRPGMVASLDIQTGERTVLDYLLKPFRKAQLEAMRER